MRRKKTDDAGLCPSCHLEVFLPNVKRVSWTRTAAPQQSTVKLCARIRAYGRKVGAKSCPHFPESESLLNYVTGKRRKKR